MTEYDMRDTEIIVNLEDMIQLAIRYAESGKFSDFQTILEYILTIDDTVDDSVAEKHRVERAKQQRIFAMIRFALGVGDPFNRYP